MSAKQTAADQIHRRLVFNRNLLLWSHLILGSVTAFTLLSREDLSKFPYWTRGAGIAVTIMAAPVLLPYVYSLFYSRKLVTERRLAAWGFVLVLVADTVIAELLIFGVIPFKPFGLGLILFTIYGVIVNGAAANIIFDRS